MLRGDNCWTENSHKRAAEIGVSDSSHFNQPATNFFDQGGGIYFGELEEALMQGVVGNRNKEENKSAIFTTRPPPTLEIFPSWPMNFQKSNMENSKSIESSDSESVQHTISQLERDTPTSVKCSSEQSSKPTQNQEMVTSDPLSKPKEKMKAGGSTAELVGRKQDPKTLRRLAQNREAAKKSRLRKKAYVQQLESSRIKLAQLEQDLQRARSQGLFLGGGNSNGRSITSGAAMFDMEYSRWLDENCKHMNELRGGLEAHLPDNDLRVLVDECLSNYDEIFHIKAIAAKTDVFHLITGMWITPAERCFIWMGGFRPSDLIKIVMPQLDPLTEQQLMGICSLQQSSHQAEEALSQGFEQLQHSLTDTISGGSPNEMGHMAMALGKLENLEGFVRQADNLRQQTLHQLRRVLTVRQAARCFLAIGEYYSRLRALSSVWASRPRHNLMPEDSNCHLSMDVQIMHQPPIQSHFPAF